MTRWVPCGPDFVTGDMVRWSEPIWKQRVRKTDQARKIGMRQITATVKGRNGEWALLEVEPGGCILRPFDGYQGIVGKEHMVEGEIRRRRRPIGEGDAHRALCGDHCAACREPGVEACAEFSRQGWAPPAWCKREGNRAHAVPSSVKSQDLARGCGSRRPMPARGCGMVNRSAEVLP
jgi:hypothetical protein